MAFDGNMVIVIIIDPNCGKVMATDMTLDCSTGPDITWLQVTAQATPITTILSCSARDMCYKKGYPGNDH